MKKNLKSHIENLLRVNVQKVRSISGGDISQAYLLETGSERFFCKVNHENQAYQMFLEEKTGLEAIGQTRTIAVPKVMLCESLEKGGLLLMEYVEPKAASPKEMTRFGHELAALHQQSHNGDFGWETDNFIGSLPQSNNKHTDWSEFYVAERLLPQLRFARDGNRLQDQEIPSESTLLKTCQNIFPQANPSLLHGDLWSGNYLVSQEGIAYLIDPATYYGHHEVDMAMSRLFGGFGTAFYDAYAEQFPKESGEAERNDIYQLYYLLVHLNLFGGSYRASVKNILARYFLT